jgi:hypothetical protein
VASARAPGGGNRQVVGASAQLPCQVSLENRRSARPGPALGVFVDADQPSRPCLSQAALREPCGRGARAGVSILRAGLPKLGLDDPVQQISTLIEFDGVESIRLFSGFRGSGKTTELLRLQRLLEERGYFVLYADALNYVNSAEPIEITDLLMVMAGAFSDALEDKLEKDIAQETFWDRIWTFLNSEINLKEASAKIAYETPAKELFGSVKTGLDLKFELKSATNFRRELQGFLANKLKELKNNVDRFFEDGIKQIRKARGEDTQVVFIFDQLEQLRGTLQTEQEVIRSVERIFAIHVDLLKIPYVHAVFTVPPWLKFVRREPFKSPCCAQCICGTTTPPALIASRHGRCFVL